jgi:chemotaxis protein CheZ
MPVQRRVFRIEEGARASALDTADLHPGFMAELRALREMMAPQSGPSRDANERARAQIAEAEAYKRELGLIHDAVARTRGEMSAFGTKAQGGEYAARASRELVAIAGGTEQATQSILQAAEQIDQAAHVLAASLKSTHDQGLAQDIQERVVQIFEACNFHDLTGQRISHVLGTLKFVEDHVARLLAVWHRIEQFAPQITTEEADRRLLNGPKLPDDRGHFSQDDIDTMFDCSPDPQVSPAA